MQTYILTKIFFGVYKKTCKHSNKLLKQTIKNSLREPIFIISLFTNQWFKSGFGKIIESGQTRIHHTVNKYSKRTTVLITKIQITVLKFSILHKEAVWGGGGWIRPTNICPTSCISEHFLIVFTRWRIWNRKSWFCKESNIYCIKSVIYWIFVKPYYFYTKKIPKPFCLIFKNLFDSQGAIGHFVNVMLVVELFKWSKFYHVTKTEENVPRLMYSNHSTI